MNEFSGRTLTAVYRFAEREDGAVTVDWVALTAILCAMIIWIFTIVTEASVNDAATVVKDRVLASTERTGF